MSQQINLYDPALERQYDPLSLLNVAAGALVLLVLVLAGSFWAHQRLGTVEAEAQAVADQLKATQERAQALTTQVAAIKPDPRVAEELAAARSELDNRQAVLGVLSKGLGPEAPSFAEYLRGLARQTASGLWLVGFSVEGDGGAMEIRGRMTDASLLPDYIRRLNGERAFQCRSFAALQIKAIEPAAPTAPAAPGAAVPAAPPVVVAPFTEFVLAPAQPAVSGRAAR